MAKKLSRRQEAMLAYIEQFIDEHSYPPTIRDIQRELGISSTSVVDYNLNALEQRNLIRRNRNISRGIELVQRQPQLSNLVRIPIVGRIAAGEPIPVLEDVEEVEIPDEDLRIDVYRSSGPGGQGVNTTDSAVRITHLPSGIVVSCQNERSQLQNKATALHLLKAKLAEIERQEREKELAALRGEQREVAWGSQIRSYFLHPNQLVKDLRTGHETGNTQAVLDGDLDDLIAAYLRWKATQD
jgi:protein subunit release factor A